MTLSFNEKYPERMGELAGQPNYFIQKIWNSNPFLKLDSEILIDYYAKYECNFKHGWNQYLNIPPKLHTIREDKADRWKAGNNIHFVINNRTKNRFQFAPVIKCVSVQEIEIKYKILRHRVSPSGIDQYVEVNVFLDGLKLIKNEVEKLVINDGFPSLEAFFLFFNKDFQGKIIHWTDLKY